MSLPSTKKHFVEVCVCCVCGTVCHVYIYMYMYHMVLVWLRAVHVWLRKSGFFFLFSIHVRAIEANVCVSNVTCFT